VADASGNGNTGTIVNATWTTAGMYGDALSFNGTNARVDINDAASLHLTTAMTLEAWVNPSAVSSAWRDLVYKGNDNYYLMATTDHSSLPGGGIIAGGTYAETFGTTILATNTWTHLATTYDGATLRLFVNGVQVSSVAKTGTILTSTNPLQLGGDSIYGQYFQGLIDEVRVYNVALTAAQIQADMNTPITSDTQPPTAPTNLMAAAGGAGQINLSWTASTDDVSVTGYMVERQDPGSTTFVQIGTTTATTYADTGLEANSTYSYRVRATDGAGNLSPYSNVASATTSTIQFSISPHTATLNFAQTQQFTANATAVNWSVDGVVGGSASTGTITSTGLYTAPNSVGTHTVTGTTADSLHADSASIYVTDAAPLLHISSNGRYFLDSNNQPFYLVGDTAWALPAGLTLSQATSYFQTRASQGFNTVLMDADIQMGASPVGAPVRGPQDAYGNLPFNGYLPGTSTFDVSTVPAPGDTASTAGKYWQNIDNLITAAAQNGIEILLDVYDNYNPWFGFQSSPNSTAQLTAYGQFLGQRYANVDNIIWMLGNDYSENPGGDASLTAVIQGIRQYDSRHLGWALDEYGATLDNTGLRQYLQLNSVYEYSPGPWRSLYLSQYNRSDFGPTFNVESGYEYNTSLGVTEANVRNEHYSFLLNGATGDMYGNEYVWPFASSWQDWQAALTSEGGREMTYLANLVNSIPWYNLIPDQNGTVFQDVGSPTDYSGAYTSDGTLALAYQPATGTTSQSFLVNMGQFAGSVTAQWYDPTNGTYTTIGTFANSGTHTFNSPSTNSAGQNDFVLVLGGPLPQRTFAVPSAVSADAPPPLTIAELQSVIPAAIAEWQIAGADANQVQALQNAQFAIADLPTTYLGWTFAPVTGDPAHPGQVVIDRTAQGFGWFIDAGPAGDAGFTLQVAPTERHAPAGSPPSKRFDLLTVVAHELGHILGLPDILDEANHPGDLMDQTLNPGVRRLIAAESLVNTAPLASSPAADGLDNGAVSAPALAGSLALATPVSHRETAPSASAILFEQWWQAGFLSPNFAARTASAALPNVPASLHEAPALLPPPDRVAALAEQTSSGFPSQVETRCTAAERASLLLAMAELRPAFDEWGNELCNCLTAR
jgi:chitodextrinase